MFFKEEKAQTALEYVLIIGAAILVAAVVIAVLVRTSSKASEDTNASYNIAKEKLNDLNKIAEDASK